MKVFTRKNQLGINYEYSVVSNVNYNGELYIIYTDFVNDKDGEIRLFCSRLQNNNIVDIEPKLSEKIINDFKKSEKYYLSKMLEVIK